MERLTPGISELIRLKANAALLNVDGPDQVMGGLLERLRDGRERIAVLELQLSDYREALGFYESWIAWLEGRLSIAGIEPNDMWDEENA